MKIHKLTHSAILPYGLIIDDRLATTRRDGNGWGILFRERSSGWRVAYLILRNKSINRLECHDSPETFEPIKGQAVIALASSPDPDKVRLFALNKPIVLKKLVWHGIFTLSKESHIKIVENINLSSEYYKLRHQKCRI